MSIEIYVPDEHIYPSKFKLIAVSALVGALIAGICNIEYLLWANAASIPFSIHYPFFLGTVLAGAIAGVVTVLYSYGIIIGVFTYVLFPFMLASALGGADYLGPPSYSTSLRSSSALYYLLYAGYIVSYSALIAVILINKKRYPDAEIPLYASDNPLYRSEGIAASVYVIAILLFLFHSYMGKFVIEKANSPETTAATFCWVVDSADSGNIRLYKNLFTKQSYAILEKNPQMINQMKTTVKMPAKSAVRRQIVHGNGYIFSKELYQNDQVAIVKAITDDSFGSDNPNYSIMMKLEGKSLDITSFYLIKENGKWKLYTLPNMAASIPLGG